MSHSDISKKRSDMEFKQISDRISQTSSNTVFIMAFFKHGGKLYLHGTEKTIGRSVPDSPLVLALKGKCKIPVNEVVMFSDEGIPDLANPKSFKASHLLTESFIEATTYELVFVTTTHFYERPTAERILSSLNAHLSIEEIKNAIPTVIKGETL